METREYGTAGPCVVVIHGGPGAPGYMAPVARRLAEGFRVLEPWQRGSGSEPLTVARHVADLDELVRSCSVGSRPALVGHSWGAMLALAFAAAHPGRAAALVLVACGTFDRTARADLHETLERRMDDGLRRRLKGLSLRFPDPDERLAESGRVTLPLYSYELAADDPEFAKCDARAHRESWGDMLRLQETGVYPAAFAAIDVPVLMLHGAADPHPGALIRASLAPHLRRLEYREWERCGHYPWLERHVREEFFAVLREWLGGQVFTSYGRSLG